MFFKTNLHFILTLCALHLSCASNRINIYRSQIEDSTTKYYAIWKLDSFGCQNQRQKIISVIENSLTETKNLDSNLCIQKLGKYTFRKWDSKSITYYYSIGCTLAKEYDFLVVVFNLDGKLKLVVREIE